MASAGCAALLLWVSAAVTHGGQVRPAPWTVTTGEIRVTCPLTVGGSFEAKTTSLTGNLSLDSSGSMLSGELSVDLATLDTGIALRNEHMRDKYLEVAKGSDYARAVLSGIAAGDVSGDFKEGARPFTARLLLHGTTRPVSGRATLKRQASGVRVDATFPVRLSEHGIPDPRYLGVGVGKEVTVRAVFLANPAS